MEGEMEETAKPKDAVERAQGILLVIVLVLLAAAMPAVHVMALLHVLPGGTTSSECDNATRPGARA
jgi:hypothetical protein